MSIVGETSRLQSDIKAAFDKSSRDLKLQPQIDVKPLHQKLTDAGKISGSGFLASMQREMQAGASPAAAAVGVTISKAVTGSISANQRLFHAAGSMIASTLKGAVLAGVAGVGALVSASLFKGFQRLESLDKARKQLENMGKSAEDVKKIMDDVNKVVTGTPIALNDALAEVPKLLAANIKPGKELTDVLTAMADATGFLGDPAMFESISRGFDKVINNAKLGADELTNEFEKLPLRNWLAKSLGVDQPALEKMISDGKIGIQQLVTAIEQGAGGMAKAAGETIEGAMANAVTAATRTAANLISAALGGDPVKATDNIVDALGRVTEKFDQLSAWVNAHSEEIHQFFMKMGDFARQAGEALGGIVKWLIDHPGVVKAAMIVWGGAEVISAIASMGKLAAGAKEIATAMGLISTTNAAATITNVGTAATGAMAGVSALAGGLTIVAGILAAIQSGKTFNQTFNPTGTDLTKIPQGGNINDYYDVNTGQLKPGVTVGPNGMLQKGPVPLPSAGSIFGPAYGPGQATAPDVNTLPGGVPMPPGISPGVNPNVRPGGGTSWQGMMMPTAAPATAAGASWDQIDAAAKQFGLTMTSGTRPGSTNLVGTPDLHSAGRARDYSGSPQQMLAFANYMASTYGSQLAELIFDAPGFNSTIKNGVVEGPFGAFYTLGQAGYHGDHVHIGLGGGGGIPGFGGGDRVPIWGEPGEHMLTKEDVAAMGGQGGVYAFRRGLHMQGGGSIKLDPENPFNPNMTIDTSTTTSSGPAVGFIPAELLSIPNTFRMGTHGFRKQVKGLKPGNVEEWFWAGTHGFEVPNWETLDKSNLGWFSGYQQGGEITDDIKQKAAELGVTPEEYMSMVAAGSTQHGALGGAPPGPGGGPSVSPPEQADLTSGRTPGFVPAGAGTTSVAGTSFVAGLLNMGNEAVGGLIDIGAQAAQSAISAGAAAGTFGAGGAAGAAAGPAIQLAAAEAKRGVSYGFQMGAILADSLIEQVFGPFGGPPRWIGYDYTQFAPHVNIGQFGTTTLEKAFQQGMQPGQQPGGPVSPELQPGMQPPGPPVPKFGTPAPPMPPPGQHLPEGTTPGQPPPPGPQPPPPPNVVPPSPSQGQPTEPGPADWLKGLFGFDDGGWWYPGQAGINQTRRPEAVLSADQWDSLTNAPASGGGIHNHWHVTVSDMDDMMRRVESQKRLDMMRYSSRP